MSTYKITFSSLNHAWANDAKLSESGQDAGDSANPYTDTTYTVTLTLDGSQVAQADVDGSTTLSFDADLSTGDHVLVATCSTGTDGVCVDKFEVGSNEAVASRYKYNEVTAGGSASQTPPNILPCLWPGHSQDPASKIRETWKLRSLEIRDSTSPQNENYQNQNPCRPKCRRGLDQWVKILAPFEAISGQVFHGPNKSKRC